MNIHMPLAPYDIEKDIQKVTRVIFRLMRMSKAGWVYWDQVAREVTGSTVDAPRLSGLASLPEAQHLFATKDNAVKLTLAGIEYAKSLPPDSPTFLGVIADAVIQYASRLKPIVLNVNAVSTVAPAGSKVVQAVHVDLTDEILPSETPVRMCPQNARQTHGKIVGQEPDGGVLFVAFDCEIIPAQLPAQLRIDKAYLLSQLATQLQGLAEIPERMLSLFCQAEGASLLAEEDSKALAEQLAGLPPPWTRFLWGPPGAGKTFGLGHFVSQLLKTHPEETVLIVAPSNLAVDVAIEHLVTRMTVNSMAALVDQRKVLRFGYPRKTSVIDKPELLGPPHLDALNKQVQAVSRQIAKAEHERMSDADLAVLRAELLAAQEQVKEAVGQHVRQCSVVATTTTLAYMPTSPVSQTKWDTVIIDEVTMVPPAMCTVLSSMARTRLLLAGDPRQLGPVYEDGGQQTEAAYTWLGCDILSL